MNNVEFGKYLKELRLKRDFKIRQVELYAKISNGYLSQVENGKTGIPSPKILKKLAPVYKVELEQLLEKAGWTDKITSIIDNNEDIELKEYYVIAKRAKEKGISAEKLEKLIDLF